MPLFDPIQWFTSENSGGHELSRLIAALPDIKNPKEINRIFREIVGPAKHKLPLSFKPLFWASTASDNLLAWSLRAGSNFFSRKFIAGNGEEEILKACASMKRRGFFTNIDILGEAVLSEKEADKYVKSYLSLIPSMANHFGGEELSFSMKLSAVYSQADPTSPENTSDIIVSKVRPILRMLNKNGGHIYLDAEGYEFLETYCRVFKKLYGAFGNTVRFVLQSYLRDSGGVLSDLIQINDKRSPLSLRLVRGANWDYECFLAEEMGWPTPPVFTEKDDTDRNFEELLQRGLTNGLVVALGTHNANSIHYATSNKFVEGISEVQFLLGMGEPLARAMRKKGHRIRFYMPVLFPEGDINEAMAYLIRRIVENRSQTAFLATHRGKKLKEALAILKKIPRKEVA